MKNLISILLIFNLFSCGNEDKSVMTPLPTPSKPVEQIEQPKQLELNKELASTPKITVSEKASFYFKNSDDSKLQGISTTNKYLRDKLIRLNTNSLKDEAEFENNPDLYMDFWSLSINLDTVSGKLNSSNITLSADINIFSSINTDKLEICSSSLFDDQGNQVSYNETKTVWNKQQLVKEKQGTITFTGLNRDQIQKAVNRKGYITIKFNDFCFNNNDRTLTEILEENKEELATVIISTSEESKLFYLKENTPLKQFLRGQFKDATFNSRGLLTSLNRIKSEISTDQLLRQITKADLNKHFWHLTNAKNLRQEAISGEQYMLVSSSVNEFINNHTNKSRLETISVIGGEAKKSVNIPKGSVITMKLSAINRIPIIKSFKKDVNINGCTRMYYNEITGYNPVSINANSVSKNLLELSTALFNGPLLNSNQILSTYSSGNDIYVKFYAGSDLLGHTNHLTFKVKSSPISSYEEKKRCIKATSNIDEQLNFVGMRNFCKDATIPALMIQNCFPVIKEKEFIITIFAEDS